MEEVKIIELKIPNLGEAETTEIIEINISPGDSINENDPLIVLESEKAAMEIPSDHEGKIIETLVKEGDLVSEGQVFAKMETKSKAIEQSDSSRGQLSTETFEVQTPNNIKNESVITDFKGINAGPAVRKYARELDININKIEGTGRNGRITKDDLKNFIHKEMQANGSYPSQNDFIKFGKFEVEKQSKIRALGAKNMSLAWNSIPHVTHFEEAEMTRINALREVKNLSPLAFFIKVASTSLRKFKIFNSSLLADHKILFKDYINIGIAVDTPDGLIVPVIKEADKKDLNQISSEISDLAEKAKTKKLRTSDLEGATFTISSLGKIGGTGFTPIINPPEVAILAISRSFKALRLQGKNVVEVDMIPYSLSYDHRVINGADAGRFMQFFKEELESFND